jgi:hypothetical protein
MAKNPAVATGVIISRASPTFTVGPWPLAWFLQVRVQYDSGHLSSQTTTDALGHATNCTYDEDGNKLSETAAA